jgi:large repetitive protein
LNVQATDDCGAVTSRVVSVTSNEPERGPGSGNHAPDWIIGQDGQSLALRAERSGRNKGGRIYTVTIATTDSGGNSTNGTVTVIVPHDNRRTPPPPAAKPEKPEKPGKPAKKGKKK